MYQLIKSMKYLNIKEFSRKGRISERSIYRFYSKNIDLKSNTIKKGNKRLYPQEHVKYFDREAMFDECELLKLENKSMRNLIDGLIDKDSLTRHLWEKDWSFFITVSYKFEKSKKVCFRLMNEIFEIFNQKYGGETELMMFFVTEEYKDREGHHNHFALYVKKQKFHDLILAEIKEFFKFDRLDIQPYDKYKAGLFYMTKGGLVNEDWDVLGNNLGN